MLQAINGFQGKYRFLSNFYPSKLTVCGIEYLNSEAAFQAGKTLDISRRHEFTNLTASQAKKQGRKLKLRDDWEITRIEIMELCLRSKFSNKNLRAKLVATDNIELIEFNNWGDSFWGVTSKGGQNKLGQLLMLVRADLI